MCKNCGNCDPCKKKKKRKSKPKPKMNSLQFFEGERIVRPKTTSRRKPIDLLYLDMIKRMKMENQTFKAKTDVGNTLNPLESIFEEDYIPIDEQIPLRLETPKSAEPKTPMSAEPKTPKSVESTPNTFSDKKRMKQAEDLDALFEYGRSKSSYNGADDISYGSYRELQGYLKKKLDKDDYKDIFGGGTRGGVKQTDVFAKAKGYTDNTHRKLG